MDLTMDNSSSSSGKSVKEDIEVGTPAITKGQDDFITISYPIASSIFPDKLVFKINAEYEEFIDQSLNCVLIALILPAMRSGSRIILNGPVSERLLCSCQGNLQSIVNLVLGYDLIPVVLNGGFTTNVRVKGNFVATGFSGGIDSYSVKEKA